MKSSLLRTVIVATLVAVVFAFASFAPTAPARDRQTNSPVPPDGDAPSGKQLAPQTSRADSAATGPAIPRKQNPRMAHWAFQPIRRPEVPRVVSGDRSRNAIDWFVAARLSQSGLERSREADRATLIRRLKIDLLGLPPTPEEVQAFVADDSPGAYERLVDRYLASPHYGERWARHWLDVVRFAESDGFETNQNRPNAWPYRDYVIQAFNEDLPYDRFVAEQLAGDALGADAATGFLVGGPVDRVKSPDMALTLQQRADELHDMVNTTSSAFLGLTVGCARCHDHKFDPISQVDYYAMKADFAGVQHGERPLNDSDAAARAKVAADLRRKIKGIEQKLAEKQPYAHLGPTVLLDADAATQLVPRAGVQAYAAGADRGQRNDLGDIDRLPTLGKGYTYWAKVAGRDLLAWEPKVAGRFRVWLSWGAGFKSHAADARYLLDQNEIACVDQRKFADGTGDMQDQPQWSGFYNAGVHEFAPKSRLVLRAGDSDSLVTADILLLQAVAGDDAERAKSPSLRAPVTRLSNVERFPPVEAKYVRMTITETSQLEPCIDELEVFTAESPPRNAALASSGTKATASSTLPGVAIHKLEHINDGKYGNSWSWISNERGKGWVQLEFPKTVRIDRIIWSRDREKEENGYNDRLPTKYVFEVATEPGKWRTVASSDDRLPRQLKIDLPTIVGVKVEEIPAIRQCLTEKRKCQARLRDVTINAMAYCGTFTSPETTYRLDRGDAMQKREVIAPGAVDEFGTKLHLGKDESEQARRLALAKWITDASNPLTARVIVNRLWQHHFGTGIVATPSDFGLNGSRPSHPELLDWLASELIAGGWHLKPLHRLIVLSSTYRQSSAANEKGLATDAGARFLWRYPPRRLEAEPLRDAILSVSGRLDRRMGGAGFDLFEPNTNYVKVYVPKKECGPAEWRRLIYQNKPRMQLDDTFGSFDCPDGGQITPKRNSSTTALQALNLLNGRFVMQQADLFARRVQEASGNDVAAQVRRAFSLAFQRDPNAQELAAATALVRDHGLAALCRALLNANEFLYVF